MTLLDKGAETSLKSSDLILLNHSCYSDLNNKINKISEINSFEIPDQREYHHVDWHKFDIMIAKIIVKMQCRKINIESRYIDQINRPEYMRKIKFKCEREMERMKKTFAKDINLSLFDFYMSNENELVDILRNKAVVGAFETTNFHAKFPLYAELILRQYKTGVERKNFVDEGKEKLQILFPKLFDECVNKILNFLSDKDIIMLFNNCFSFRQKNVIQDVYYDYIMNKPPLFN